MRKRQYSKIIVLGALCCAFSTACSGGGGGGISQSVATSANTASTSGPSGPFSNDTGIAGTVAAPAAAIFGSAPPQLATSGGPSFDGSSGSYPSTYPSNVTFPLIISGLQKTSTGLSPTPSDPAATATVINDSSNFSAVLLVIPSLGLNQTITMNTDATGGEVGGTPIYGLRYVDVGGWAQWRSTANPFALTNGGVFVFGFETPQAAMPTSGTAVFSGGADADVYKTVGTEIQTTGVGGSVSITANFGSGAVTGSLTKMRTTQTNSQPWNDVMLTANIVQRVQTGSAAPQRPPRRQAHQ